MHRLVKPFMTPSPSGFCLPASGVFSATTIDGNDQSTDRNINGDRFITLFANNQGGYFYCKPMKASGELGYYRRDPLFPKLTRQEQ